MFRRKSVNVFLSLLLSLISLTVLQIKTPAQAQTLKKYYGNVVIINPYSTTDMTFLQCAATAATSPPNAACNGVSLTASPFVPQLVSGTEVQPATGILLRMPWCGYQTQIPTTTGDSVAGSCHYRIQGETNGSVGTYTAGQFASGTYQISGMTSSQVDSVISNLSSCTSTYDNCSTSVLKTALGYIATINAQYPLQGIELGLSAGQYTPTTILDADGSIDLPVNGGANNQINWCTRQPQAWQKVYGTNYATAVQSLVVMVKAYAGLPPIVSLKEGGIVSNSMEFDVPAQQSTTFYTDLDPSYMSTSGDGIQGDAVLRCPDYTTGFAANPTGNGSQALLAAYALSPTGSLLITDAYEQAFGRIVGYEAAFLEKNGLLGGALISVGSKGSQAFAHVLCDTYTGGSNGNTYTDKPLTEASTCEVDPDSGSIIGTTRYGTSLYYFIRFVNDLFVNPSYAYNGAAAAYAGIVTDGSTFSLPASQFSVIYTGLQPTMPQTFASIPSCWLNANTPSTPPLSGYTLPVLPVGLGSTEIDNLNVPGNSVTTIPGTPTMAGTLDGWQTATSLHSDCGGANDTYLTGLKNGTNNGGQFTEIETDAAGDSSCWADMATTSAIMTTGSGNTTTHCNFGN